jgi:cytochrome bd-type quinol oxidase subunit 2
MMGFIWFWLVAVMIVGYVVLDGFDLGVGVLHLFLARTEAERRATLASIGPVWDGNEVWLLAGGGIADLAEAHTLLCLSAALRFGLQRFLFAVDDRALAVDFARHQCRIAQSH